MANTFYYGEEPVGHFDSDAPSQSGRFEYTPFRGLGHALMASTLDQGEAARCWFERNEERVAFDVVAEEFVLAPEGPGSNWYVEVLLLDSDGSDTLSS